MAFGFGGLVLLGWAGRLFLSSMVAPPREPVPALREFSEFLATAPPETQAALLSRTGEISPPNRKTAALEDPGAPMRWKVQLRQSIDGMQSRDLLASALGLSENPDREPIELAKLTARQQLDLVSEVQVVMDRLPENTENERTGLLTLLQRACVHSECIARVKPVLMKEIARPPSKAGDVEDHFSPFHALSLYFDSEPDTGERARALGAIPRSDLDEVSRAMAENISLGLSGIDPAPSPEPEKAVSSSE